MPYHQTLSHLGVGPDDIIQSYQGIKDRKILFAISHIPVLAQYQQVSSFVWHLLVVSQCFKHVLVLHSTLGR